MLQDLTANGSASSKSSVPRWAVVAIAAILATGGMAAYKFQQDQSNQAQAVQEAAASLSEVKTVTALGRLEPQGKVIKLSAPTSTQESRIDQLLVKEGDRIKKGQVVAILDSRDRLQAAFDEAQEQVRVAQAKLAVTQAGAKQGEIEAQRSEIARLEAEHQGEIEAQAATVERMKSALQNARSEYTRYQSLFQEGGISASNLDSKRLALDTAQKNLEEAQAVLQRLRLTSPSEVNKARATLSQIAEVRPVDVAADRAEVNRAIAAMNQAKANLEQVYVRSPIDGEVLYVHSRSGEVVSSDGIAEIGQNRQMYAVAEVYQSDVSKVRAGQRVRVSSDSIPGELHGVVERVGSQVMRQTIINTDPSTNIDARVVEVQVALDAASSQKAAKFTNLQVRVVMEQ
ncbi:ABC exporter membrane fusion protein [Kovacikia minuta CCNUW1]|uniref:ABC exporter membrane fusion protein n=1 Tax=Kovacikia minuta TaxID=2931930 RepID=UPI001CCAE35F|nr:ABC exporter membrane fusion protein [Kovacikia minuta]UBF27209.1 ABC exporter membrane fusion protein [Kovacikia minuta CCNUW1]